MYELDRQQFGAFVARLRKEKGYTQKESWPSSCTCRTKR